MSKGVVRPFADGDLDQVVALRRKTFSYSRWTADEKLADYFRDVFFDNPWRDEELPSLVYEEQPGTIVGFLGIIPRPWTLRGKPVRGAVATQFMVAPGSQAFAAWELLRHAFAGPQDFLVADVGNGLVHPLWERLGGTTAHCYSLFWTRTLRPARAASRRIGSGPVARAVRRAALPLLDAVDGVVARRSGAANGTVAQREAPLEVALMAEELPHLVGFRSLHPSYDERSLGWLLDRVRAKWHDQSVQGAVIRGHNDEIAGWFLYVAGAEGTAQILQIVARDGRYREVIHHLLAHARQWGAVQVRGRFQPSCLAELGAAGCCFHYHGPGVLVHSLSPAVLETILGGRSMLSGLDGEWWLDF